MRNAVRRVAAIIAALSFAWALWLAWTGGVEVILLGRKFASHDPMRLFWIGVVGTSVWIWARGAARTWQQWQAIASRVSPRALALSAAALIVTLGALYSTKVGTGADSYGYVSETDFWMAGGNPLAQPWVKEVPWPDAEWTFTPLGYRPSETTSTPTIVPTYSPGLPWLYGAVKRIAGHCAMFLVVPIAGGVLILATYGIGRRLGSPSVGAIAACLVATSPIVMYMVPLPMSDVPVAAAWAAAIFFLFGGGVGNAIGAGLATACAIAIRPNLAPCAVALAAWYVVDRPRWLTRAVAFGGCAAIGVVAIAWVNHRLFGSIGRSGYGKLNEQIALANFAPNVRLYLGWLLETQTWAVLAGIAAVVLPIRWFWPDVSDRRRLWIIALFTIVVCVEYTGYLVFDSWMYLRFFLPIWPLLMLGLASIAVRLTRLNTPALALTVAGFLAALIVSRYLEGLGRGSWQQWKDAQRDAAIVAHVGASIEPNAIVLSMIHSGSMRYYGGRMTLRYDILKPEWLDRGVAWLNDHGAHPYLLLADWEVYKFRDRFPGTRTLERLSSPLATFSGSTTQLFDLAEEGHPTQVIDVPIGCPEPVPAPAFHVNR